LAQLWSKREDRSTGKPRKRWSWKESGVMR